MGKKYIFTFEGLIEQQRKTREKKSWTTAVDTWSWGHSYLRNTGITEQPELNAPRLNCWSISLFVVEPSGKITRGESLHSPDSIPLCLSPIISTVACFASGVPPRGANMLSVTRQIKSKTGIPLMKAPANAARSPYKASVTAAMSKPDTWFTTYVETRPSGFL